jgi:hypothetical protein
LTGDEIPNIRRVEFEMEEDTSLEKSKNSEVVGQLKNLDIFTLS